MRLKRITLIRPNMGNYRSNDALPPLALAILAARTPKEIAVRFYDDRIESIPQDDRPDIVALSVETFTAQRAYEIAMQYRQRGCLVVMGGYHPTLMPDEALEYADAVVLGDAEGSWEALLDDVQRDCLQKRYSGGNRETLDDYQIDRSIFLGKKYLPVELVQYSRGCRFSCEFCSIDAFYNQKVRTREVEQVIEEIKHLDPKKLLFFVDDNLFGSPRALMRLLESLEKLKIRWSCQISIDVAKDEILLDKLQAAGCIFVLVGFESLSEENLKQMGKSWNSVSGNYKETIQKFHHRGIAVYGTFVFGYDGDTPQLIDRSLRFAQETKLEIANFNPLTPTPGSKLYRRLVKEGRMVDAKWWLNKHFRYGDPIFEPKGMSARALSQHCFEAKKRFYSWRSIFMRLFVSPIRFKRFRFTMVLLANIVSRIEIYRKQYRKLGEGS
jgi:radical SAM superfamily enzyme YgiQ (UPF0313 family)